MRRDTSFVLPFLGSLAAIATVSGHRVEHRAPIESQYRGILSRQAGDGVCKVTQPTVDATSKNIWAGLTNQEMADAIDFLYKSKELNLTRDGGR